jgi:hypothetical protein
LESLKTHIDLTEIRYPVFRLGTLKPTEEAGVVFYLYSNNKYSIVDDKSIVGESLSSRRLHMLSTGVKLRKITRAIFFLGDLLKLATKTTWFIDSNGLVFQIKKSLRTTLEYLRIKKVIPIKTGGAIIELDGANMRLKSLFAPTPNELYAGVLKYGLAYILYGFFTEKHSTTWRWI